ncbi:zinc finger protein 600-like, partial [Limulus polyphemus]|uniref:Zinc finger protein 600-like n=1 Tax=Limulus polyphemus TaxID=6850 RepID=A0ABM1TAZ6_LIMPO
KLKSTVEKKHLNLLYEKPVPTEKENYEKKTPYNCNSDFGRKSSNLFKNAYAHISASEIKRDFAINKNHGKQLFHPEESEFKNLEVQFTWNHLLEEFQDHQKDNIEGFQGFKCSMCGSFLGSKKSLVVHISRQHRNRKEYKCHLCDKVYTRTENLNLHVRKNHIEKNQKTNDLEYEIQFQKCIDTSYI